MTPAPGLVPELVSKRHSLSSHSLAREAWARWESKQGKERYTLAVGRVVYDLVVERARISGKPREVVTEALVLFAIRNNLPLTLKSPGIYKGHHFVLKLFVVPWVVQKIHSLGMGIVGPDKTKCGGGVGTRKSSAGMAAIVRALVEAAAPLCDLSGGAPTRRIVKRRRTQQQMIEFWGPPSVAP